MSGSEARVCVSTAGTGEGNTTVEQGECQRPVGLQASGKPGGGRCQSPARQRMVTRTSDWSQEPSFPPVAMGSYVH